MLFEMTSTCRDVRAPWQNANVFELVADPGERLSMELNGTRTVYRLSDLLQRSHGLYFRQDCVDQLKERVGLTPGIPEREDGNGE